MSNIATRTHSLFSPSRLAMLQKCPSWMGKSSGEGGIPSADAQRGVDLHEAITSAFLQGVQSHDEPVIDYVLSQLANIRREYPYCEWQAEAALDTGIHLVTGYCDIVGVDSFEDAACIIELKSGFSERPEAASNIQLKAYSLALLKQVEVVRGFLIEADQKKITSASWTRADMLTIHREIISIIREALQGGKRQAGLHCDYCSKAVICPSLEGALQSVKLYEESIEQVKHLSPDEVSEKLMNHWENMALIERYWGALKSRAMSIIEAGGEIEGFTVKVSSGIRKWTDEQAAIDSLNKAGVDLAAVMALQSPAQVEKALKAAGKRASEIKGMLSSLTAAGERKQLVKVSRVLP
jgi:CRISPR/Cas system-associated exonuclease Cas4 (RecB family)